MDSFSTELPYVSPRSTYTSRSCAVVEGDRRVTDGEQSILLCVHTTECTIQGPVQLSEEVAGLLTERKGLQPASGLARFCTLPAWAEAALVSTMCAGVAARSSPVHHISMLALFWP